MRRGILHPLRKAGVRVEPLRQEPTAPMGRRNPPKLQFSVAKDSEDTRIPPRSGSCVTPVGSVAGKAITTIEGLSPDGSHPLQKAWIEYDVPQCGYCHSGQILSAAALLAKNPTPSEVDIAKAMSGNICRCGTYQRIRYAIRCASQMMAEGGKK